VTRIAEGLHGNISRLAPPLGQVPEHGARGIAGFVYRTVRTGSSLVGYGVDALLASVQALLPLEDLGRAAPAEATGRRALVAALNGVIGDHLARKGNPLAPPMELVVRGAAKPRLLLLDLLSDAALPQVAELARSPRLKRQPRAAALPSVGQPHGAHDGHEDFPSGPAERLDPAED
jgi:hypothetical protein